MKKQLLLFLPILIICSLSLLIVSSAQSAPTVTVSTSHSTIQQSNNAQQIEFIIKLSNKSPVAKDISGVDFVLCSSSPYLVLDSKPIELTDAFDYESKTGSAANPNTLEGMLYQELSTSSVTYKDSKFTALKIKGTAPASVAYDEFVLMRINATLSADAPAGTYTVTAKDFTASDLNGKAIITNDFACSVEVKENKTSVGETYKSYYLTLQGNTNSGVGGDIGLNLRITLTDELLKDKNAYLKAEYDGQIRTLSFGELTYNSKNNEYILKTPIKAANMAKPVKVTVYSGNGEHGNTYTYSIKSYCDIILRDYAEQYPNLVPMLHAMLNYGAAAQVYFGVDTNNLVNAGLSNADGWGSVDEINSIDNVSPAIYSGKFEDVGILDHTIALVLNAETTIRHTIYLNNGDTINNYEFRINNNIVSAQKSGEKYYIKVNNIPASHLDSGYTLSIKRLSDSVVYSVNYSAMNYVKTAYEIYKDNKAYTNLCNLLKTIYMYNNAAKEYFGG